MSSGRAGVLRFLWYPTEMVRDFTFAIQQTVSLENERDYAISVGCRDVLGARLNPIGGRLRWSQPLNSHFVYPSKAAGLLRVSWSGDTAIGSVEFKVVPWQTKQIASKSYGVAVIGAGSAPREYEVLSALEEDES